MADIGLLAELERGLISERSSAGVKAVQRLGEIRAHAETYTAADRPMLKS